MTTISGWITGISGATVPRGRSLAWETTHEPKPSYLAYQNSRQIVAWYEASLDDQLFRLAELEEDWDGYGGPAIDAGIVNNTKHILKLLDPPADHLLPSSSGTIFVEWEGLLGRASLEIGLDTFGFYTAPKVGRSIFLGGSIRGLEVGDINFAVSTIAGKVVPFSVESIDWSFGIEGFYPEGTAAA